MEARTVSIRDGKFKAVVNHGGSGEKLLYLHHSGGLEPSGHIEQLAEQFEVYAPFHPGWGDSEGIEHLDDIIDFALYYHDFMDELGIESAHVVGHSIGGMLAAELAALCSHRVKRLVLSNPVGIWRDDAPVLDFFTVMPNEIGPYVYKDPTSEAVRNSVKMPEGQDAMIELMYQRIQSFTSAGKFLWPIPDRGLKKRIHRIQAPTLIVWGEHDGLVSSSYAEDFRTSIKDSRVVILKDSSHFPMVEQADEWLSAVTEFLKGT